MDLHIDLSDSTQRVQDPRVEHDAVNFAFTAPLGGPVQSFLTDAPLRDVSLYELEPTGVLGLEIKQGRRKRAGDGDDVCLLREKDREGRETETTGGTGENDGLGGHGEG